jgi:type II secretory pathway predicted ATPase ExeA
MATTFVNNMLQNLLNASVQPFRATPDSRFYFEHPSIESARQTILRAVIRAEGPVVVLGGAGYGKSLLADLVADQLCQRLDIVLLQSARLNSRRALLQSILFELGLPYLDMSEGELRLSILDRLEPSPETAPEGVLVLVDEAHTLHWKLIDELRLITNFKRNHQPRVRLALFGNMRLEETLASPQLESFNQRLAARCYLQPMSRSETTTYIQHQLQECGVDPVTVITQDGLNSVFAASEGIPRLINQLMTHAIWLATNSAQSPISAALINEAWSDLQQLPTPWTSGKSDQDSTHLSIEFGNLPDDEDDHEELECLTQPDSAPAGWDLAAVDQSDSTSSIPESSSSTATAMSVEIGPTQSSSPDPSNPQKQVSIGTGEEYDLSTDNNFFAAFHSTPSSQFLKELDDGSGDDMWRVKAAETRHFELEINLAAPTSKPSTDVSSAVTQSIPLDHTGFNWFDAELSPVPSPTADQFRSGDHERISSLMAEQQQYDAMGMWENDPPLSKPVLEQPNASMQSSDQSNTVFGDDFDDEMVVSIDSPIGPCRSTATTIAPSADSVRQPDQSPDYLARMQQYADAITGAAHKSAPCTPPSTNCSTTDCLSSPSEDNLLADSLWSIDVSPAAASPSNEMPLEDAIEDMVSQLNFSAFSMEPFSVEQIPLEPQAKPVPYDSMRRGSNNDIYMMHRPLSPINDPIVEPVDDDSDLLIVEEEIPVSVRALDSNSTDQPAEKAPSYSQLFARLRK